MNELTPSYPSAAPSPRKVALVLSSGGARGYAHIGAIKALHERGYTISSVAGASMGALIVPANSTPPQHGFASSHAAKYCHCLISH